PERLAVQDGIDQWNYQDLDLRANQLAHWLREQGVGRGDVVAIYAHRSASLVWAILGIFKAGAAYTILDPAYPPARLVTYLRQVQPQGLVSIGAAGELSGPVAAFCAEASLRCQITLPGKQAASAQGL